MPSFYYGLFSGIFVGFIIFLFLLFFTPLGGRYKAMNEQGPGMYLIDTWRGDVWICGIALDKAGCMKLDELNFDSKSEHEVKQEETLVEEFEERHQTPALDKLLEESEQNPKQGE